MRILAVDTALGLCSAAVLDTAKDEIIARESIPMERGHAESLMPLVDRVMAQVPGGFSVLARIATTVGPGSFTGLRVGLSAARAMALAASIPVVGITTLSAFAAPFLEGGGDQMVASVIDARHGHVFMQISRGDGSILLPPQLIALTDAESRIRAANVRIVGSAASLFASLLTDSGQKLRVEPDQRGPDIEWVARLGGYASPDDAKPVPLYLRAADAVPQNNGRIALQ